MTDKREGPAGQDGAEPQRLKSASSENSPTAPTTQGKTRLEVPDVEPWPDPIDGAKLLDDIAAVITRYLALPDGATEALALWIVFSHGFDAFDVSPRLALLSPVPECGKTTALTLLRHLVRRPILASNVSAAVIFRAIEQWRPTLLIDEADTYLHDNASMAGILNSGHRRGAACVLRVDGPDFQPAQFSTWAPLAIAKIGKLPPALTSRSVIIHMRRALPGEIGERFGSAQSAELMALARQAARWVADALAVLRSADPEMPAGFGGRLADNWRPLLAIADAAGGDWPARARKAAALLSGEPEPPAGAPLLAAIKRAFDEGPQDRLSSKELCQRLNAERLHGDDDGADDCPWDILNPKSLALQLEPFGIRPKTRRIPGQTKTLRGYARSDFADAFARYLPPESTESATPQQDSDIKGMDET